MKNALKVCIVLLGYVGAIGLGFLVGYLHEKFAPDWANQYSGMYAEGTSILFFEVTGIACIFPTLLGLFFLRKVPRFWTFYSWALLGFAATGPLMEAIGIILNLTVATGPDSMKNVPLAIFLFLVIVRIFSILFLAPADFLSAVMSTDPKNRKRLFMAFGIECGLGIFVVFDIAVRHKFM